jgi:DNA-binding NarL/FixJ family response regulator
LNEERPVRVILADDHGPTREDIRFAVEQYDQFVVCAEAVDAPGAIEAASASVPTWRCFDIKLAGSGIAAA